MGTANMNSYLLVVTSLAWTGLSSPVPGGYAPKCRTVYETGYSTSYEQQCSTTYEQQCSTAMSSSAPHPMKSSAPPQWRQVTSSSAPPLMSSNAPLPMRHLTRRSAPPPTSRSAQAQGMEVMEREVLATEANKLAPKFPSKVAPVSQSRSRCRNAPVCQ